MVGGTRQTRCLQIAGVAFATFAAAYIHQRGGAFGVFGVGLDVGAVIVVQQFADGGEAVCGGQPVDERGDFGTGNLPIFGSDAAGNQAFAAGQTDEFVGKFALQVFAHTRRSGGGEQGECGRTDKVVFGRVKQIRSDTCAVRDAVAGIDVVGNAQKIGAEIRSPLA